MKNSRTISNGTGAVLTIQNRPSILMNIKAACVITVSRIVFQASVGALILNRVVSMLDAIRIYRATSAKSFSSRVQFEPEFYDDGAALYMNVKF